MVDYSQITNEKELKKYINENNLIHENNIIETKIEQASSITKYKNIFDNIILLTGSNDPSKNKTLETIIDAIKNIKSDKGKEPKLYVFESDTIDYDEGINELKIWDGNKKINIPNINVSNEITITDEFNNTNTLVIVRLSVLKEEQCKRITTLLQDRGFLVLNPINAAQLASNKYETAIILEKNKLPQPNFALITKDICENEQSWTDSIKDVYKDWGKDKDEDDKKEFVAKILDGHGGTGVILITGKQLIPIMQMIFVINPEQRILLQKKEEADGGDLRVHVLTLSDKQVILGAMKRLKIKSDFRSNVSLGATAEKAELTKEQTEIALKAASISGMPWCAVDIMPLIKDSNKDIGDNVILELNASPGTEGISDVMDENFINILLNELDDPSQFKIQQKIAGFRETMHVDMGDGKETEFLAKLDTGNGARFSTLGVDNIEVSDDEKTLIAKKGNKKYKYDIIDTSIVMTGDKKNKRYNVKIPQMKIGLRMLKNIIVSIVDDRKKSTDALISRNDLDRFGYVINSRETHMLTPEKEILKYK